MQFSMVGTRNSLHSIDMVYSMLITGTIIREKWQYDLKI